MKIGINVGIATKAKIVMARNEDEDDDLFHDHHVPRKSLLAVMVSSEEVLDVDDRLDSFCFEREIPPWNLSLSERYIIVVDVLDILSKTPNF